MDVCTYLGTFGLFFTCFLLFIRFLPLIAIAAVVAFMGNRAEHILPPTGAWLFAHWPALVGPLTAAIGIGLLAFGIVQLSS